MEFWSTPEFHTGFAAGVAALIVLLAIASLTESKRARAPLPLGGVAFTVAGLFAVHQSRAIPASVVIAVAGIGAMVAVTSRLGLPTVATAVLTLPFAWVLGTDGGVFTTRWIQILVTVVASVGAAVVAHTDRAWRDEALAPSLLAITVLGVYFTVPDTEEAAALVGVALPLAALGWPLRSSALGRSGAAASTALVIWVAAIGGRGRPPSIVGSVACLGLLVGLSAGRWLMPRSGATLARVSRSLVLVLAMTGQLWLVWMGSRLAGLVTDLRYATGLAVIIGVASILLGSLFPPLDAAPALLHRRPREDPSPALDGVEADGNAARGRVGWLQPRSSRADL
jgi:hypothetical protein